MLKVHSVESLGTYDGPGIRLVYFLQGCNFKCLYCANADTIALKGGSATSVEEILKMAENQRPFFGKKGGVTFSGGEPLVQARALVPVLKALKDHGLHVCIDTNGSIFNDEVREALEYVDIVLLDIKHMDDLWHHKITGKGNTHTLELAAYLREKNIPVWLRYVLVPGYTNQPEALHGLGKHFAGYENVEKLEIQPYHELGAHKYEYMGWKYQLNETPMNTPEQLEQARHLLSAYFREVVVN